MWFKKDFPFEVSIGAKLLIQNSGMIEIFRCSFIVVYISCAWEFDSRYALKMRRSIKTYRQWIQKEQAALFGRAACVQSETTMCIRLFQNGHLLNRLEVIGLHFVEVNSA